MADTTGAVGRGNGISAAQQIAQRSLDRPQAEATLPPAASYTPGSTAEAKPDKMSWWTTTGTETAKDGSTVTHSVGDKGTPLEGVTLDVTKRPDSPVIEMDQKGPSGEYRTYEHPNGQSFTTHISPEGRVVESYSTSPDGFMSIDTAGMDLLGGDIAAPLHMINQFPDGIGKLKLGDLNGGGFIPPQSQAGGGGLSGLASKFVFKAETGLGVVLDKASQVKSLIGDTLLFARDARNNTGSQSGPIAEFDSTAG